jgi:hypothetical protein
MTYLAVPSAAATAMARRSASPSHSRRDRVLAIAGVADEYPARPVRLTEVIRHGGTVELVDPGGGSKPIGERGNELDCLEIVALVPRDLLARLRVDNACVRSAERSTTALVSVWATRIRWLNRLVPLREPKLDHGSEPANPQREHLDLTRTDARSYLRLVRGQQWPQAFC